MARQQRRRASNRQGGARRGAPVDENPPSIDVSPASRRTLRYQCVLTNNAKIVVTRACLMSSLVATPAITASTMSGTLVPLFEAVRLRRVTIRLPGIAGTGTTDGSGLFSVNLEWLSYLGRNSNITKTVTSSRGAVLSSVPPAGSRAAMWGSASINATGLSSIEEQLFTITHVLDALDLSTSVNAVVDIEFDAVVSDDLQASLAWTSAAGPTNNTNSGIFAMPLDHLSSSNTLGSQLLQPVGYQNFEIDGANARFALATLVRTN